ncbi:MAG: exosortase K [Desulfobacteraceae bacterium]
MMSHPFVPLPSQATRLCSSSHVNMGHGKIRIRVMRILAAVATLLTMLALKRHYSLATPDQLEWILAPTAKLVAWLTRAHPVHESGVGYVDFTRGIIVAPACAGVNFMIMAFGLAALCGLAKVRRLAAILVWPAVALSCAYGYTLVINALRIGLSMVLYEADIYGGWISAERVHRLMGIGLYLSALWIFYRSLQFMLSRISKGGRPLPAWLPLGWYLAGAVGVPLVNLLFQSPTSSFGEHILTVLMAIPCYGALAAMVLRMVKRTGTRRWVRHFFLNLKNLPFLTRSNAVGSAENGRDRARPYKTIAPTNDGFMASTIARKAGDLDSR